MRPPLLPLILLGACAPGDGQKADGEADSGASAPPAWCEGATAHRYDPDAVEDADLFPDGLLEVDDPASPTGRRIDLRPEVAPWIDRAPPLLAGSLAALDGMSGYGSTGGVLLRFTAPVAAAPADAAASVTDPGWRLVELDSGARVPFEAELQEGGLTAVIWPLRPLRPGVAHAFVLTTEAPAADGGCVAPAPTTRALLHGESDDPRVIAAAPRYREALGALGLAADEVSALTVFTVHEEGRAFTELAEVVSQEEVSWVGSPSCEERGGLRECSARLTLLDRRGPGGRVSAEVEPVEAEIPITVWLPLGDGPFPVVLYGHGLGSRRSEGGRAAYEMVELGYALVAMEAVGHGDHPSSTGGALTPAALGFLGVDLTLLQIQSDVLRGNFDQTNLDRLRLLRLLRTAPDWDGDGQDEFSTDQLAYLGVSLGAILGPQLLAHAPEVQAAALTVGGGRLLSIVTDTEAVASFSDLIGALVGSPERFDRLVPLAQHVVDPVDPARWAPHVLDGRLDGAAPPSLLLQVGLHDEVVPKTAGFALARALDLPHLQPVAEPVDLLEEVGPAPLSGNREGGAATAAYFQLDRVQDGGRVVRATHIETPTSPEGILQMRVFLEGWLSGGVPEVIDPYAELGTPAL